MTTALTRSLISLPAALLLCATAAQAATRHLSGTGSAFSIDSPCARSVTVQPDPSLSGQIEIDATAEHQGELDGLKLETNGGLQLKGPEECWPGAGSFNFVLGDHRTLTIAIRVPPHINLSVDESGPTEYVVGDVGTLDLDLSGPVKLQAGTANEVKADISGPGQVRIARATGNMHAELSGPSHITVEHGELANVELEISGPGGFHLGSGSIADLHVDDSGVAGVDINGTVGNARVELSGVGSVHINHVTGKLSKDVSGIGSVEVGE